MKKNTGNIKDRLVKAFMQVTLILSVVAVVAVIAMFFMSSRYEHAMKYYGFSQGDIGKAMTALSETRSYVRAGIGYDTQEEIDKMLDQYEESKKDLENYMKDVKLCVVTKEGQTAYDNASVAIDEYLKIADEIIVQGGVIDIAESKKAQERAFAELAPVYEKASLTLSGFMDINVNKGDEMHNLMFVLKIVITLLMIVIIMLAVTVSFKIGESISTNIQRPLEELSLRIKTFAQGDLDTPFPEVKTDDEIAAIIKDCNEMAGELRDIISDVGYIMGEMAEGNFALKTKVEEKYRGSFNTILMSMRKLNRKLNSTLSKINEATEQVSAGSTDLAGSAQDLAEGATEQAGAVEELTATVDNVSSISQNNAKEAENAAEKAKKAAEKADKSKQDMMVLIGAMERISETSKEIENIIAEIEDIASQTNLLSLNASIEAARAGDAGKGFAVVADQIGKLATDSSQSAVTTKQLIEKALLEVNKGNEVVSTTMEAINEVLEHIEALSKVVSDSAQASRTEADMLKQIEGGIDQISTVVQSNSAASQQTSAISEELSAQAISLKGMVEVFKFRED